LIRWELVENLGWTLDEVDSMSVADFHEYMMINMGRAKARGK
jgi:UDP-N-acetylenolpyruvoylglucosamine reductase